MRKQQRAGGTVGCFFSSRRCSRTLCARSSSLTRGVTCCGKHDLFATLASLDPKRVPSRDLHKAPPAHELHFRHLPTGVDALGGDYSIMLAGVARATRNSDTLRPWQKLFVFPLIFAQ